MGAILKGKTMKMTTICAGVFAFVFSFGAVQAATITSIPGQDVFSLSTTEYTEHTVEIGDSGFSLFLKVGSSRESSLSDVFVEFATLGSPSSTARNTGDFNHTVEFATAGSIRDNVEIGADSGFDWADGLALFTAGSPLAEQGSTARIGLRLTKEVYSKGERKLVCNFKNGRNYCRYQYPDAHYDLVEVGYGYLDFERGSLILNGFALNTTGAITTPKVSVVPLPAGLPLLLAGLGGLGLVSRRKRAS